MKASIYCWLCLAWLGFGFVTAVDAKELAVGDTVPSFSAKDQFGMDFTFVPGPKFLLLGFDMGACKAANAKLAKLGNGGLDKLGIVYVMDIHTMPAIGRFFAMPKMRKYPFRVVLGDSTDLLKPFPRQSEKISVLELSPKGTIRAIHYWNPDSEVLAESLK